MTMSDDSRCAALQTWKNPLTLLQSFTKFKVERTNKTICTVQIKKQNKRGLGNEHHKGFY